MRVFVTGGTGYVGSAVLDAFLRDQWEVGALVRSEEKANEVKAKGAVPVIGRLQDPETWRNFCAISDAVVHCAFESPELDALAAEEILGALLAQGEQRMFLYTSGIWVLGHTRGEVDESARTDPPALVSWRPGLETRLLENAQLEVVTAVIRPGWVYGGAGGAFDSWWQEAKEHGRITVVGDGSNHLPLVHRDDLAELYLRIVRRREGGVFHGVEEGCPTQSQLAHACAEAVGPQVELRQKALSDAREVMGPFADARVLDQQVTAPRARALGWAPAHEPFVRRARVIHDEWTAAQGMFD